MGQGGTHRPGVRWGLRAFGCFSSGKKHTSLSTDRALGAILTPVLWAWLLSPTAGDETRVQRGEGAWGWHSWLIAEPAAGEVLGGAEGTGVDGDRWLRRKSRRLRRGRK